MTLFAVGDHIVHRAWGTKGVVIEVPERVLPLSNVKVEWEDGRVMDAWIPAIMHDFDYMEWSDDDELLDTDDWTTG